MKEKEINMDKIITKRMIRDLIIFKGPISISSLAYSIFKDENVKPYQFNIIMAHILELESEGIVKYNISLGCYETDMILN